MQMLKKVWKKIGEPQFVSRVVTIGLTLISLMMMIMFPLAPAAAWFMGIINGFLILAEWDNTED